MQALPIDIWSDVACPWCWVGKRNLEAALEQFEHPIKITWHAFELNPGAPKKVEGEVDYVGRLARKYGVSKAQSQAMIDRMVRVGAEKGLDFRFDRARPTNTFDAHRLLLWAATQGKQHALKERLFLAYMHEGGDVADRDQLVNLAEAVGLDPDRAQALLSSDELTREVREEEAAAHEMGVSGVPFFVLGRRYAIPGAQPADVILGALERAWEEQGERVELETVAEAPAGAVCGPDGCRLPEAG